VSQEYARLAVVLDTEKGWGSTVRCSAGALPVMKITVEVSPDALPEMVIRVPMSSVDLEIAHPAGAAL
jgi:hypothetical protein